jgi:hypothetical protein
LIKGNFFTGLYNRSQTKNGESPMKEKPVQNFTEIEQLNSGIPIRATADVDLRNLVKIIKGTNTNSENAEDCKRINRGLSFINQFTTTSVLNDNNKRLSILNTGKKFSYMSASVAKRERISLTEIMDSEE